MIDPYEELGIPAGSAPDVARKAFKKIALECHPDKFQDSEERARAEERFKRANTACQQIVDDRAQEHPFFGADSYNVEDLFGSFSFEQMFSSFFGQKNDRHANKVIEINIDIPIEVALWGGSIDASCDLLDDCDRCGSSGAAEGAPNYIACRACGGSGATKNTNGFLIISRTCGSCLGTGRTLANPCDACGGSGALKKRGAVRFDVPRWTTDGELFRLQRSGVTKGTQTILCRAKIVSHDGWTIEKRSMRRSTVLRTSQALLGCSLSVELPGGKQIDIEVPERTLLPTELEMRVSELPDNGTVVLNLQHQPLLVLSPDARACLQRFDEIIERERTTGDNQ